MEYDNYYQLLGVDESDSTEEIENRARRLLAEYHPDVSSMERAEEIYDAINSAERVLTDKEQREIYDSLGHDNYISKREKYGKVKTGSDLSDLEVASVTEEGNLIQNDEASRDHLDRASEGTPTKESTDGVFGIAQTKIESPKAPVVNLFHRATAIRVFGVVVAYLIGEIVLTGRGGVEVGGITTTGTGITTIISVVVGLGVVVWTGKKAQRELINANVQEMFEQEESEGDTNSDSVIEAATQYQQAETHPKNAGNGAVTQVFVLITIGLTLILLGALAQGSHPLVFMRAVLTSQSTDTALWLDYGSETTTQLMLVVNVLLGSIMFISILVGGVAGAYSLSKAAWVSGYLHSKGVSPIAIDMCIYFSFGLLISGFGNPEKTIFKGVQNGGVIGDIMLTNDGTVSGIALLIIGLFILLGLAFIRKNR